MYGDTLVMRRRAAQLREQGEDIRTMAEQLASLEAAGFVGSAGGQEVTSQVFQITRVP